MLTAFWGSVLGFPRRLIFLPDAWLKKYEAYYARTFYTPDPDNLPDPFAEITMGMVDASANNPAEQERILQEEEDASFLPAEDAAAASPDEVPIPKGSGTGLV